MTRLNCAGLRRTGILGAIIAAAVVTSAPAYAFVPGANAVQAQAASTAFTPGDLVVYRVGTGSAALNGNAAPVFLDEYSPSGTLVESVPLPTATSGANKPLVASGTASSEGLLTLSGNGNCLLATGYDAALNASTLSGATSTSVPRTIAVVNTSATVDTSTALMDNNSANNIRSASSQDCSGLYVGGASTGVSYTTIGSSTSTLLTTSGSSTTYKNVREVQVVDNQLYTSADPSKAGLTIAQVGSGLPTSGLQTPVNLNFNSSPAGPYQYAFLTLGSSSTTNGPDTLYVADNSASAILKYSLVSGTWTKTGSAPLNGVIGLTANDVSGTVTIDATSATGIYALTDNSGSGGTLSGTPSLIASPAANTSIAGIAFAPGTTIGSGGTPPPPPASSPTITPAYSDLPAAEDAASNPTLAITVGDTSSSITALSVGLTVTGSSNTTIAPLSAITLTQSAGTGNWTLGVTPPSNVAAGTSTITLQATDPNGATSTQTVTYDLSAPQGGLQTANPSETGKPVYYDGAGNASTEVSVGGGYFLAGDDELNPLNLYKDGVNSEPVKTYDFTSSLPYGATTIDIEAAASYTQGANQFIYWFGSESTSSSGNARPATNTVFETEVSGTAPNLTVTYLGSYSGLRSDLVNWDSNNGNPLNLSAASTTTAKSTAGLNIEGAEFAPGSTSTVYLAFRAPLEPYANDSSSQDTGASSQDALLVPVTNLPSLIQNSNTTSTTGLATFGSPIELNLGGLGFREMRKNANNQYLIVAGTSGGSDSAAALYAWDGQPGDPAVLTRTTLPDPSSTDQTNGAWAWEGIVSTPSLVDGNTVELVQDDGDYVWYANKESTKSSPELAPAAKKDLGATFTLELASQTVSDSSTAPTGAAVGGTYTPTATASSGLPVTDTIDASSTSGACSISSGKVSFTGVGTCVIDANQAGDYGYDAAPQVQQSVTVSATPQSPPALISEWRPVGPSGAAGDDYVDIANISASALTTTGWTLDFVNASGTQDAVALSGSIPVGGHLLAADSTAYSLGSSGSNGSLASGNPDVSYTLPGGFGTPVGVKVLDSAGNLVDAVGFAGAPAGFFEGTALTSPTNYPSGQFSYTRTYSAGALVNSESNASDYSLLSTSGDGGSVPGVPGPLDLAAPVVHNNILQSSLVDPNVSANASPNFVYTASAQIVDINRTLTNCSGNQSSLAVCVNAQSGTTAQTVTRLQFRVTGLTTGVLLAESSSSGAFPDANNTSYPVSGLSLSTPAGSTAGLNAVLVGTSDLPSGGLAPGASISVDFRFAVVAHGPYTFAYNAEDDLEAYSAATTSEPTATSSALSPVISPPSADSDSPVAASSDATPIAQTTSGAINASSATATVTPAAKSAAAIQKVIKRHGVKKKATKRHVKKHTTKKHAVKRKRTRQHGIERGTTKSHAARKAAGSKIAESTTVS